MKRDLRPFAIGALAMLLIASQPIEFVTIALAGSPVAVAASQPAGAANATRLTCDTPALVGLWRFNLETADREAYGVLRLDRDCSAYKRSGGTTSSGIRFDGAGYDGRWQGMRNADGSTRISVDWSGEGRPDVLELQSDGTLRLTTGSEDLRYEKLDLPD